MSQSLRQSAQVSLAILGSRVLGLVRESLFAAIFGVSAYADAFSVAFRVPNMLRDLFAEGAMSNALVPTLSKTLTQDGKQAALQLVQYVLSLLSLLLCVLVLLGEWQTEALINTLSAFEMRESADITALTIELTRIMLPYIAMVSVMAVGNALLNALGEFRWPALMPVLFNVVSIAVGLSIWGLGLPMQQAVQGWSLGVLLAGVVQLVVLVPKLRAQGLRVRPRVAQFWRNSRLRSLGGLLVPALIGVAPVQLNIAVNTRLASELPEGSVRIIEQGFRLFYLPIGAIGVALSIVATVKVAQAIAAGNRQALVTQVQENAAVIWMLLGASSIGLWVLAEPIVVLLYERGAFDAQATLRTVPVVQFYALALVPYGFVKLLAPISYGFDRPRYALLASALAVLCNLGFNLSFYQEWGAKTLPLGMGLGALVNALVLWGAYRYLLRTSPALQGKPTVKASRSMVQSAAVLALSLLIMAGVCAGSAWGWAHTVRPVGFSSLLLALSTGLWLAVTIAVVLVLHLRLLSYWGYPGAKVLLHALKNKRAR